MMIFRHVQLKCAVMTGSIFVILSVLSVISGASIAEIKLAKKLVGVKHNREAKCLRFGRKKKNPKPIEITQVSGIVCFGGA